MTEVIAPNLERAIRNHFAPRLWEDRFSGSGRTFRRTHDGWVLVLNMQSLRSGHQFAINLGLQPLAVVDVLGNKPDPKKISVSLCEFRQRLSCDGNDQWWAYELTQDSMDMATQAASAVYATTGRVLLEKVFGSSSPFDAVTPEVFSRGDFDFGGFDSTRVRMALVIARLRRAQGRHAESAAFANIGLASLGSAVALRRELKELSGQG